MRKVWTLLPIAASLMMAGCSLAPSFVRPEAPIAQAWPQDAATQNAKVLTQGLQAWGDFFKDERLIKLIDKALKDNRNLRAAMENVQQARMMYGASVSGLFPSVNAVANRTVEGKFDPSESTKHGEYKASASAAFELDLFGRIRNQNEIALQSYFKTEAAQRTAQMTLISEIAQAWLGLGASKDLLKLANDTLESREKSLDLIRQSYDLGAASQIDVHQAQTLVSSAKIAQTSALRQVAQSRNALTLLAGGEVTPELEPDTLKMDVAAPISALSNVPSEVLLNRPDIATAEANLRSANANIGVARAAFFPTISITGALGIASPSFSGLFDHQQKTWNYTPNVSLPIFSAGSQIMNLKAANAAQRAAVASYEAAIQGAFREVADALATEGTVADQLKATEALAQATRKTFELAQERYNNGVDSYLEMLDSQRSDFSAQQSLINAQLNRVSSLITLYKVMGGGSQLSEETAKTEPDQKKVQGNE